MRYCKDCVPEQFKRVSNEPEPRKALIVAGSISNSQQRTMRFETSGTFSRHPEMKTDLTVNVGRKALLSFLNNEDRCLLALDTWHGENDRARFAAQMTANHYTFNVIAIDEATDREIQKTTQRNSTERQYIS